VDRIAKVLGQRLRLGLGVESVTVQEGGQKLVRDSRGGEEAFDEVLFACHPDQALRMLGGGKAHDRAKPLLGRFHYADNDVYLHSDER
jgi:uncharacterized protein